MEHILLITMLFLFTINLPKKKTFRQNTIYNPFCLKKNLVLIRKKFIEKNYLNYNHLISIKTIHFNLKKETIFDYFFVFFFCYFPDMRFSKIIFVFNLTFSLVGRETLLFDLAIFTLTFFQLDTNM